MARRQTPEQIAQELINNLLPRIEKFYDYRSMPFSVLNEILVNYSQRLAKELDRRVSAEPDASRSKYLRELLVRRGLLSAAESSYARLKAALVRTAGISGAEVDNVCKGSYRCSKGVIYRLALCLCANSGEVRKLFALLGLRKLEQNRAENFIENLTAHPQWRANMDALYRNAGWIYMQDASVSLYECWSNPGILRGMARCTPELHAVLHAAEGLFKRFCRNFFEDVVLQHWNRPERSESDLEALWLKSPALNAACLDQIWIAGQFRADFRVFCIAALWADEGMDAANCCRMALDAALKLARADAGASAADVWNGTAEAACVPELQELCGHAVEAGGVYGCAADEIWNHPDRMKKNWPDAKSRGLMSEIGRIQRHFCRTEDENAAQKSGEGPLEQLRDAYFTAIDGLSVVKRSGRVLSECGKKIREQEPCLRRPIHTHRLLGLAADVSSGTLDNLDIPGYRANKQTAYRCMMVLCEDDAARLKAFYESFGLVCLPHDLADVTMKLNVQTDFFRSVTDGLIEKLTWLSSPEVYGDAYFVFWLVYLTMLRHHGGEKGLVSCFGNLRQVERQLEKQPDARRKKGDAGNV